MEHPLRRFRKRQSLSLDAFAAKLGVSKTSMSRIETGKQNVSLALARRITALTGGEVTANDMVGAFEPGAAE